jgi:DNA (cytosine-5)-methyltransferase 1
VAVHPETFNIISLCTGGGGLDLGVELAMPGARTVCMVEREAFAASHLVCAMQQGLLDEAPVWSNARTFNGRPWRGLVDGLIGGIPCQPHSLAGLRQGEDDERDLWSTARRIIVQSGCWFVLIENVGAMLSSGGAERVWRDFRRLGFELEGGLFTASEVGAPHERERIFILAVADCDNEYGHGSGNFRPGWRREFTDSGIELADADSARLAIGQRPTIQRGTLRHERLAAPPRGDGMADCGDLFPPGRSDLHSWRHILERAPELEPAFRRVADGLASRLDIARVDRLRLLGNGVVSLEGAYAFRTLATRLAASGSIAAKRLVRGMVMTDSEIREAAE